MRVELLQPFMFIILNWILEISSEISTFLHQEVILTKIVQISVQFIKESEKIQDLKVFEVALIVLGYLS